MKRSHLLIFPIVLAFFNCEKEEIVIKKDILIKSYTRDAIEILTDADTTWLWHQSITHQYTENNDLILSQSEDNIDFERYHYDSENQLRKITGGNRNQFGVDGKTHVYSETYISREENKIIEEYYQHSHLYKIIEYSLNGNQVVRKDNFWISDDAKAHRYYEIYEWEQDNISVIQTFLSNHELYATTSFEYDFDIINPWKSLELSYRPISKNAETKAYTHYDGVISINEYAYEKGDNYITKASYGILDGDRSEDQFLERFTY